MRTSWNKFRKWSIKESKQKESTQEESKQTESKHMDHWFFKEKQTYIFLHNLFRWNMQTVTTWFALARKINIRQSFVLPFRRLSLFRLQFISTYCFSEHFWSFVIFVLFVLVVEGVVERQTYQKYFSIYTECWNMSKNTFSKKNPQMSNMCPNRHRSCSNMSNNYSKMCLKRYSSFSHVFR